MFYNELKVSYQKRLPAAERQIQKPVARALSYALKNFLPGELTGTATSRRSTAMNTPGIAGVRK
ncbi:hypothetical protein OHJ16_14060 [Actinomyces israelii]|uniref:Transposase n=1 Tax=Actinomyces israelii TaxID=1659 RepID=A0ABT4IBP0_9ACTO|nr:hypothetical protein [Actinomyces israelii]MCZ0859164.1 hypothetical protein [Actinomyces israelii]